ncbi:isochorismate synthase [Phycicoccus endophyticus]|uniref:isochorismate synthase n=1 Tax=Phycicoccus endophyticus TaxID=1690220 RepID=A0A7G9QZI0_9MICO|nr:isochorismate synthase [Phycicoccus endophyticus]NHI19118.1 isochorismate synthase [Phycicoccus endophyticus]QNN48755.1 isochorismate synthase [Phycicoccus endophyticus]GGL32927.1 isochorismate synthase [Phycicoccus endophyticus]
MTSLPAGRPDASASAAPLVARTVPVDPSLAEDLLRVLPPGPATDPCSWVRRGEGLVGWGRAASHVASGPQRFAELERWWRELVASAVVRDEVRQPGSGPVAFGSVAYADGSAAGGTLVVPEVLVGRRGEHAWLTTVSAGPAVAAVPGPAEVEAHPQPERPDGVAFSDGALTPSGWSAAVATALGRITGGELDKVVLARDLEVTTRAPLDVRWLLHRLAERYDTTWVFAVDGLVGATPELLVRREKGLVTSRVLAGTIRPTGDDAHDLALAASLARSSKDLEEHEYAVRSVAESLAPHCSSMNVPEAPFVLHLSNVMHLATDVAGVLVDDASSLALAASLHPSAAVCGTPRAAADAVIAELEHMDRGRYAGPVGWIDADGDGEWGIALRCGAVDPRDPTRMRLFAGCGIVAGSDPDDELAESSAKLVPMRDALTATP